MWRGSSMAIIWPICITTHPLSWTMRLTRLAKSWTHRRKIDRYFYLYTVKRRKFQENSIFSTLLLPLLLFQSVTQEQIMASVLQLGTAISIRGWSDHQQTKLTLGKGATPPLWSHSAANSALRDGGFLHHRSNNNLYILQNYVALVLRWLFATFARLNARSYPRKAGFKKLLLTENFYPYSARQLICTRPCCHVINVRSKIPAHFFQNKGPTKCNSASDLSRKLQSEYTS